MRDNELHLLLSQCQELADIEDLKIIKNLLEGVKKKLETREGTYLEHIFQVERNIASDSYELTVPVSALVNNHLDIVHGGITATIADTAMGTLIPQVLPDGYAAVTTQLNIHYLAPGVGSKITCKARFVHKGAKTMVMESEVLREDGTKIAHATASFFIIKKS